MLDPASRKNGEHHLHGRGVDRWATASGPQQNAVERFRLARLSEGGDIRSGGVSMHRMIHAVRTASSLSLLTVCIGFVAISVALTTFRASAAVDAYLKVDGIKGQSQAIVIRKAMPKAGEKGQITFVYGLTFDGKPAPPGTYACADGQHIKVVGPDGMIDVMSFSWGVSSTKWSPTIPPRSPARPQ